MGCHCLLCNRLLLLPSHFSRVRICATPEMAAHQAPLSWDSPGKNTGVGCHFLLQCMKVKSEREVTLSCPTLRDPMDCSLPGSSIHGSSQAGVLEWGAIAFSVTDCCRKQIYGLTWRYKHLCNQHPNCKWVLPAALSFAPCVLCQPP